MNKIIIAAAGAGKTETIVKDAFEKAKTGRVLITTFTDENTNEIVMRFYKIFHRFPNNVHIFPWYTFLLRYLIKPFQNIFIPQSINGVVMKNGVSAKFTSKDSKHFYLSRDNRVYSDKVGALALKFIYDFEEFPLINLGKIFSTIYIDEMQDMGGYDLDVIKSLLTHLPNIICVCDPRQSTYFTSNGPKNKTKKGINLISFFEKVDVEIDDRSLNVNHRCHEQITSFANKLYPEFSQTESDTEYNNSHLGLFFIKSKDVRQYIQEYHPMQLREKISTPNYCKEYPVMNIGASKGKTFNRTLLFLPKTHIEWICKEKKLADKSRALLYVALTRARYSTAIVYDYTDGYQHSIISNYEYES